MKIFFITLLLFSSSVTLFGQSQAPFGRFEKDSIKLGEPINYILTFKHNSELEIYFPDSTYDFTPFEYVGKQYFPTKTDSLGSFDSVVYQLATYEIEKTQYLAVPIFRPNPKNDDKPLQISCDKDSIKLIELIAVVSDSTKFITNNGLIAVKKQFNYPYLFIGLGVFFSILIGFYFAFGGAIRKNYRIKKLKKQNLKFTTMFDELLKEFEQNPKVIEDINNNWKVYTGKLLNLPLSSFTTKEITKMLQNPKLAEALKMIDRMIYAGVSENDIQEQFTLLKDFSAEKYEEKISEIKKK